MRKTSLIQLGRAATLLSDCLLYQVCSLPSKYIRSTTCYWELVRHPSLAGISPVTEILVREIVLRHSLVDISSPDPNLTLILILTACKRGRTVFFRTKIPVTAPLGLHPSIIKMAICPSGVSVASGYLASSMVTRRCLERLHKYNTR